MAEILGCSTATIHSIESGRLKISKNLARKILHETQISPKWLLSGDVSAPPISLNHEPYTSDIFDRAQVEKIRRDYPDAHTFLMRQMGFCAMLAAILASAREKRSYFMAEYKISQALQTLRDEFGQDLEAYPSVDSTVIQLPPAVSFLKRLTDHAQIIIERAEGLIAAWEAERVKRRPSKRSSDVRKRRA